MAEAQIPYRVEILDEITLSASIAEVEALIDAVSADIVTVVTTSAPYAQIDFNVPESLVASGSYRRLIASIEALRYVKNVGSKKPNDAV